MTDLQQQLKGFQLSWLADNVKQPNGIIGCNRNTFYSYVYGRLPNPPHWLIKELSRITGREIKNQKSA